MNPLAFSILRLLSDNEFHSGTAIAEALGVSRASVSNALRDVDEAGLTIHKIKGRGYRLLDQFLHGITDAPRSLPTAADGALVPFGAEPRTLASHPPPADLVR